MSEFTSRTPIKHRGRPTLLHVARAAGVSKMTVSNVANGRLHLVRESTVNRVQDAIDRLGYRPDLHARALRLSRGWAIGMLVVTRKSDFLASQWMGRVVTGLSNYLGERGFGLLLHTHNPDNLDNSILMKWTHADGLCVLLSGSDQERKEILEKLSRLKLPLVVLQETLVPSRRSDMAVVRQDDFDGGRQLGEHLISQGAERLVFVKPDFSWPAMVERARGVVAAMTARSAVSLRTLECSNDDYDSVEAEILTELAENGLPDAFLAANESIALAILDTITGGGFHVPNDVLLTGFNAFDVWFFAKRKVTTISFPAEEIGIRAGERMLERINTGRFAEKVDVLPATLVIGDTSIRGKQPLRERKNEKDKLMPRRGLAQNRRS